ncbi:flagellar FlbD family protein [Salinibacterium sp. SYSU T00001]|uniref:flagellar FlbD family protein n=1 Tax=Homoserinimonas sedimenticola TaxID=2986805 RepID=UPI0022361A4B|nr:flagellar FlbD family protein [Salinibacterium sedimenticola]MCW4385727.1 flagellar FlbD family protein [Salinibacterium sedimenticola]
MGTMIVVTRLNDRQFAINPDLIERIHASPDTTLIMVDGAKYIVTESMTEVIERIAAYRARVIALAHTSGASDPAPPHLGLVSEAHDGDEDDEPETPADVAPFAPRKI